MAVKYRVHEVAKDFNVKSSMLIDMLLKYFDDQKKPQTALEANELDIIFDTLTLESQPESFDAYFAMQKSDEERQREKEEKEAEAASEAEAWAEEEKAKKETAAKTSTAKPDVKPAEKKQPPKPEKKTKVITGRPSVPVNRQAEKREEKKPDGPSNPFKSKKAEKNTNPENVTIQARTKGDKRTIDTRIGNVELEKYNERYDNLVSYGGNIKESDAHKQKLKQKSQQYRKQQGTRSKKRETEAERLKRIADERAKKQLVITVGDEITVGELASRLKFTATEVVKKLMTLGVMASVSEVIDFDTAEIVATELGAKVKREVVITIEDRIIDDRADEDADLVPRSPVVVVMGHVDHGKTSLLDALKDTAVTETEAGGITQHIGAYRVNLQGQDITFLDTPGHAAFTSMRARGAMATDIAILVVAADDGIMPQTVEAINHAKAAGVNIVVAINKMDKPEASPDKIMQQLTEYELIPEEWGGETICVPVSAKTKLNLDRLLESVLLVAEMKELRANPNRAAKGIVIEARLDKGRGPIATLLVQNGTLKDGDIIVAGTAVGHIRVMTDYLGKKVEEAGPSVPVEITGLAETPNAGDVFDAVSDEHLARELVEQRKLKIKEEQFNAVKRVTLDTLFSTIEAGEMKDLNIIVKADVQGSVEALTQNLEKLTNDEVRVKVIHGGVGAVSESDVMLADASNAIVIGFNVRPAPSAQAKAERDSVELRMYRVIYDCIEDVQAAIKGMLAPKFRDVEHGRAEIRNVFKLSTAGVIAGSYVLDGKIMRNSRIRVVRDGIIVAEDEISSLKRFKDDVREVASGYECGIGLVKFNDIKEGDVFEAYITEEYRED